MVKPDPNAARRLLLGTGPGGFGGRLDWARVAGDGELIKAIETVGAPLAPLSAMEAALARLSGVDRDLALVLIDEKRRLQAEAEEGKADEERREAQRQRSVKDCCERIGCDTPELYAFVAELLAPVRGDFYSAWRERRELLVGIVERDLIPRGRQTCRIAGPMLVARQKLPPGEMRPARVAFAANSTGIRAGRELALRAFGISSIGSAMIGECDGAEMRHLVDQVDEHLRRAAVTAGGAAA